MKRIFAESAIAIAALAFSGTAMGYERDEPVKVNTKNLQANIAERVEKYAAQGERELMAYLWFTRRMHHMWLDDVTKRDAEGATADNASKGEKKQLQIVTRTTGIR